MFSWLNKTVNKIRALGGEKWSDKDIVDKILTAYMATDVNNLPIERIDGPRGGVNWAFFNF
jgi:hypothetical protein